MTKEVRHYQQPQMMIHMMRFPFRLKETLFVFPNKKKPAIDDLGGDAVAGPLKKQPIRNLCLISYREQTIRHIPISLTNKQNRCQRTFICVLSGWHICATLIFADISRNSILELAIETILRECEMFIDTVLLIYFIQLTNVHLKQWKKHEDSDEDGVVTSTNYTKKIVIGSSVDVDFSFNPSKKTYKKPALRIQFSAPKVLYRNNYFLSDISDIEKIIQKLNQTIEGVQWLPKIDIGEGILNRVDVAASPSAGEFSIDSSNDLILGEAQNAGTSVELWMLDASDLTSTTLVADVPQDIDTGEVMSCSVAAATFIRLVSGGS